MISEEDLEVEIVPKNELQVLIQETKLEPQLAEEFKINFEEHFKMASTWAKKAKKIVVTDASQTVLMEEARTARLFLRKKRLEIENFRVARKEYFLNGGRAIDKVANFLKDTIIPIEEHLARQEDFVKLRKEAEDKRILEEAYAKQEADRIAKEESDRKEQERLRVENEKLRKETEEREKVNREEIEKIRKENEEVVRREREKVAELERVVRTKRIEEMKAEADAIKEKERLANSGDQEKMISFRLAVQAIVIPEVKSQINKTILMEAKSHLYLAVHKIQLQEEI